MVQIQEFHTKVYRQYVGGSKARGARHHQAGLTNKWGVKVGTFEGTPQGLRIKDNLQETSFYHHVLKFREGCGTEQQRNVTSQVNAGHCVSLFYSSPVLYSEQCA